MQFLAHEDLVAIEVFEQDGYAPRAGLRVSMNFTPRSFIQLWRPRNREQKLAIAKEGSSVRRLRSSIPDTPLEKTYLKTGILMRRED